MEAVIFDLDGVLVDSEPAHGKAISDVCDAHGVLFEIEEAIGLPDDEAFARAWRRAQRTLTGDELVALLETKKRRFAQLLEEGEVRPYPGAAALISELRNSLRLGICSAGMGEEVRAQLSLVSPEAQFMAIICAEDVTAPKPAPEPYLLTAERLGLEPTRCIAIEDSVTGVASARAAGCYVIALEHTTARAKLGGAHEIVPSIDQLVASRLVRGEPVGGD